MGLLDGILGGIIGAEMATTINGLIEKHGGVAGIVKQFQSEGFGKTVQSWVGTGGNDPISAEQIQKALGSGTVTQFAEKIGMKPEDLSAKLAEVLPGVIDKMTPGGVVPAK